MQELEFMKKMWIMSFVALVILFLVAAPVFSQDDENDEGQTIMSQSGKGACKADIEKFCKGIKPGGGRLWACLKSNSDRLSKECKDHIASMKEQLKGKKGQSEK